MYDNQLVSPEDIGVLAKTDEEFEKGNSQFFISLLEKGASIALRNRAVCILAEIGDEGCVTILSKVIKNDPNPLVRHEAAFTLGQLGYAVGVPALIEGMLKDDNILVRHEAAIALGSIGDQSAREALTQATKDPDEFVRQSAIIALLNLDYLMSSSSRVRSTRNKSSQNTISLENANRFGP